MTELNAEVELQKDVAANENNLAINAQENQSEDKATATQTAKKASNKKTKKTIDEVPRGMPKSNRPWKTPKQKFASIKKTVNRDTFEKKQQLRNELRRIKEVSKERKDQRKEDLVQKHQRRVENAERRLANERKSELVQIIKNPAKLKRLKKKQLRMIEKRDLSQVKTV